MNLKNSFIATSLAVALASGGAALLTATSSFAYDETSTASINVEAGQVILKGYDTVSYFQGKPAMGDKRFAVKHDRAHLLLRLGREHEDLPERCCALRAAVRRLLRHGRGAGQKARCRSEPVQGGRRQAVPER